MRRIAVWNTAFLGDAVLTLPLVQSLKLRFPAAPIDLYVRGGLESLFSFHPDIAAVYPYSKRGAQRGLSGSFRLARDIATRGYDLWVSPHTSLRSSMLAIASGAAMRIGYKGAALAPLAYTHTVDRRFQELEEVERLLELLKPLGEGPVAAQPLLRLDPAAVERADAFFAEAGSHVLGIHPGSVWPTKRWTVSGFAAVGARALKQGAKVVLFAGRGEEDVADKVKAAIADSVTPAQMAQLVDFSGMLTLQDLAAHIAGLRCYLTNDSGPMHLAWVQGVPVVAVFGPTVRALGFFPRGPLSAVQEYALDCRPCGLHGHRACPKGHHHCMTLIDPDDVWRAVAANLL
ncbi:glycosyltransferase family 9 protein [Desulfovibrio sp. OttesenSCG-928-G15]|nr:glycosyltransferase family 9 protein [Desulfovibrio sp. OttesenSCG-928-G15]